MKTLPRILVLLLAFVAWGFVGYKDIYALTVVEQTQRWDSLFTVYQAIQELGDNLSGTADKFTFRVSTSKDRANQFDYTGQNSRIYDKTTNTYIRSCIPAGTNSKDRLEGLSFSSDKTPSGYEDVTLDFSCRNYTFIPGHRYLIKVANANYPNSGSGTIYFAAASYGSGGDDLFTGGGVRYGNGNKWDSSNNSGICDPGLYKWNGTNPYQNGCNIWTSSKDDLYFVLTNTSLPPKAAVIFIPGIGGSELKINQDIYWEQDDGHGGSFKHAYVKDERIWVNQDEAVKLGDDDYFDVLRLKPDGVTSEADLSLTGNLTSFGYGDIDSFFTGMGYEKNKNFFVFPYDWRKDIRSTQADLDTLIETAKQKSGQTKVNIVAHSLGGLVTRNYIADAARAAKVNKLIELGVPHLGSVDSLKSLMYGVALKSKIFGILHLGIPATEIKDTVQNMASVFQLLPSNQYFNFYNNSDKDRSYPFRDDRDIDNNNVTGSLSFDQTKTLLSNLNYNMTVFALSEQFHSFVDPKLNQNNGTKIYEIIGTAQPTLGQIHETWWITWPISLIPKTEEIFINGDDTVPLYSASLKSDSLDLTGGAKIYYVEQKHSDLVSKDGVAMQTVKSILEELDLPVEVKSEKIDLEGKQISLDDGELELYDEEGKHTGLKDDGEIETNIPETFYSTSDKTKHAFIKKKSRKVTVKATRKKKTSSDPKTTNIKIRTYKQDKISKTTIYKDIPVTETAKVEFGLDPTIDTLPILILYPDSTKPESISINHTSEASGSAALDQAPPTTKVETSGTNPVTVTLTGSDSESGILKTEYSLDNGLTVNTYTKPLTISLPGKTTIQIKSIDLLGNEEIPQTITVEIITPPLPSPTPTPTPAPASSTGSSSGNNSSDNTNNTSTTTSNVGLGMNSSTQQSITSPPAVLGVTFKNPSYISDQINVSKILGENRKELSNNSPQASVDQILSRLLIISGGILTLSFFGLIATFIKPTPRKM
ncbi:hypothetical protein HYW42_02410 [Candidatus Daviesbacteria bacterium]|nr:hypothetical protein [Candidatus Daviesbacteria bacterium]